jgi:hypothetical protein
MRYWVGFDVGKVFHWVCVPVGDVARWAELQRATFSCG